MKYSLTSDSVGLFVCGVIASSFFTVTFYLSKNVPGK